jgi:hypothetical protein
LRAFTRCAAQTPQQRRHSLHSPALSLRQQDPHVDTRRLFLHFGDLTDSTNCFEVVSKARAAAAARTLPSARRDARAPLSLCR